MEKTIEQIGRDYIAFAKFADPWTNAPEEARAEALDMGWVVEDEPDRAWEAIRYVVTSYPEADFFRESGSQATQVVGLLAAGPLEDFLSAHGPEYIERIEAEARRDRRMAWALGGVWQFVMPDEIYQRVCSAAIEWTR